MTSTAQNQNQFDLDSIRLLVLSINRRILQFLEDTDSRRCLQSNLNAKLKIQKQEFFEFSEHSVLSNLYWGVQNVESAIQALTQEDKTVRLKKAEQVLQTPALLEEYGTTSGISNRYLICCSYFYLSVVWKLKGDEWQMTLHFLQSILASPQQVRIEFAPKLCEFLFLHQLEGCNEEKGCGGGIQLRSVTGVGEDEIDEAMKQMARRYKDCMMYYQVVLYGETGQLLQEFTVAHTSDLGRSNSWLKKLGYLKHGDWDEQVKKICTPDLRETTVGEIPVLVGKKQRASLADDGKSSAAKFKSKNRKCLRDIMKDYRSDTSISIYSCADSAEVSEFEEMTPEDDLSMKIPTIDALVLSSENGKRKMLHHGSVSLVNCEEMLPQKAPNFPTYEEAYDVDSNYHSTRSHVSDNDLSSILDRSHTDLTSFHSSLVEEEPAYRRLQSSNLRSFSSRLSKLRGLASSARGNVKYLRCEGSPSQVSLSHEDEDNVEMLGRFETAVSTLCFSEGLRKCEDAGIEVSVVREILGNNPGMKHGVLKEAIISQLLDVISVSKDDKIIRASVFILLVLILENKSIVESIKRKNSHLYDLGNALKQNVHEAAVVIYLLKPSPKEMKDLELLRSLLEVACDSNTYVGPVFLPLTPTAASVMMIEALVTKLDYTTSTTHLEVITSPQIISRLVNVASYRNLEVGASLAGILISCMRFDANCRNYLARVAPVAMFLHLLKSNKKHAKFAALEFFHEILCMPRSSAASLLHQIRRAGKISIMHTLMACIQQAQTVHRLLAANLLLQLDMMEDSRGKNIFREEAMDALLESVASEESPNTQALSAFILSNLGGTYAWTGEPYTIAWLLKKTGLMSLNHKNMIRNIDWSDQSLKDSGIEPCCSKIARSVIKIGNPIFQRLEKGLRSKSRGVSRDCLITIAWLGCEIATMDPGCLGYSTREALLKETMRFLHPGLELEERLLACLCVYNYASGTGMQNLMNVSEAVRESLRRLSGVTWMADELLKVTDYFLPTKSHVSCVHTQILETSRNRSAAANALIYYKGQLYSGHSDGSIKAWDIKGQTSRLVWEIKEHKKAVTCFALYEPGDSLLSGSADKTIRVWKTIRRKLKCIDLLEMKEPVQKIDTYGRMIFAITPSRGLKACDASKVTQVLCGSKRLKCIAVAQGKIYLGCTDSCIQEVDATTTTQAREIKAASKRWWKRKRPINSIVMYKDWLYSATDVVEGSHLKEWKRRGGTQVSTTTTKQKQVLALAVAEDFMYLTCSSSPSILQIWLREKPQKVGRLSAGSRITSLLAANDIILCGTESGIIKGWIPF